MCRDYAGATRAIPGSRVHRVRCGSLVEVEVQLHRKGLSGMQLFGNSLHLSNNVLHVGS